MFGSGSNGGGMSAGKWVAIGCGGLVAVMVVVGLIVGGWGVSAYNGLIRRDQAVQEGWSQVENVYQRRYDLIPNLVETVKGVATFEKDTLTGIAEARAKVGQMKVDASVVNNPEMFKQFQANQGTLGNALSRLMVVSEKYPDLKANASFRDLQAQLEGTENRIAVERRTFNKKVQDFNTTRNSFPTVIIAGFFGSKFNDKVFFKMDEGAKNAPKVNFSGK